MVKHKKRKKNFFGSILWGAILIVSIVFLVNSLFSNNQNNNENFVGPSNISNLSNYSEQSTLTPIDEFNNSNFPHWNHMPLTYEIDSNCNPRLINLTKLAFEKIKNETGGLVYYVPANETPDISVYCKPGNYTSIQYTIEDTNCLMQRNNSNIISYAEINIYGQGMVCGTGYPAIEVHELLHALGFIHSPHPNSIMYPFSADSSAECKTTHIDKTYISCLKNTYSDGRIPGNCTNMDTIINEGETNMSCGVCPDNWYSAKGSLSCCPEPNMVVDSEGYCVN